MKSLHFCVNGYAGAGKSSVLDIVVRRLEALGYLVVWIPRVTSRFPRPGERLDREYRFVTTEEFAELFLEGRLLSPHQVMIRRAVSYMTAVPCKEDWPKVESSDKVVIYISTFGYFSPTIQREYAPDMVTVFLTMHDKEEMRQRLQTRNRNLGLNYIEPWKKNLRHMEDSPEEEYDHIIYNDRTPEECAAKFMKIIEARLRKR